MSAEQNNPLDPQLQHVNTGAPETNGRATLQISAAAGDIHPRAEYVHAIPESIYAAAAAAARHRNDDDDDPENIFLVLHHGLRGRYWIAITLGVVLAVIGAVAGHFAAHPVYTAEGLIRVAPTISRILYSTDESELPPLYDSMVAAQAEYVQSLRVIENAASDPRMAPAGWPADLSAVNMLEKALQVDRRNGTQIIHVSVTCESAKQAMVAVNCVLDAYLALYGDKSSTDTSTRLAKLQTLQGDLQRTLKTQLDGISALARQYGTDDLDSLHDARLNQKLRLDEKIDQLKMQLIEEPSAPGSTVDRAPGVASTAVKADPPEGEHAGTPSANPLVASDTGVPSSGTSTNHAAGSSAKPPDPENYSPEYLAASDSDLARLLAERSNLEAQLTASAKQFGPSHIIILGLNKQIVRNRLEIQQRVSVLHALIAAGQFIPQTPGATGETGDQLSRYSHAQLEIMLKQYEAMHDQNEKDLKSLESTRQDIQKQQGEADRTKSSLDAATSAIEKLNVESSQIKAGRIENTYAGMPLTPSSDKRNLLSVMAAGLGLMLGIGGCWLLSIVRPKLRYIEEVERTQTRVPVLGTLPDLHTPSAQDAAMASMGVHHLRNLLHLRHRNQGNLSTAYVITSARPGDGKTSLAMALAISFASEGQNVVLVDADLVGRGLSHVLHLEHEQGLANATATTSIDTLIHSTHIANISAVAAGPADTCKPEQLSESVVDQLLSVLRNRFSVVIIDTGPIMGSLEANLLVALADETVLTVPRGQSPRVVDATLERLRILGARCAGIVFNRASPEDLRTSTSHLSFSSQSMRSSSSSLHSRAPDAAPTTGESRTLIKALMGQLVEEDV